MSDVNALDDGERAFAFRAFAQAGACKSSAALCMTAALNHTTLATLATGAGRADVLAALHATHQDLTRVLDGALAEAVANVSGQIN